MEVRKPTKIEKSSTRRLNYHEANRRCEKIKFKPGERMGVKHSTGKK